MTTENATKLHVISDIHVGPNHRTPNKPASLASASPAYWLEAYASHLEKLPSPPDILLVAGDIVCSGSASEFGEAKDSMRRIAKVLSSGVRSRPRICVIPGNHDLDWNESSTKRHKNFRAFCESLGHAVAFPSVNAPKTIHHPALKVSISCVDSTATGGCADEQIKNATALLKDLSHNTSVMHVKRISEISRDLEKRVLQDPGEISRQSLKKLPDQLAKVDESWLKIVLLHHNISPVPAHAVDDYDSLLNASQLKKILMDAGASIVIHGHRHFFFMEYSRYIPDETRSSSSGQPAMSRHEGTGLYTISAPSLGCSDKAPYLELSIRRGNAESDDSAAVDVHQYELETKTTTDKPSYVFSPYSSVRRCLRVIEQELVDSRELSVQQLNVLSESVDKVALPILRAQGRAHGWAFANEWVTAFNSELRQYARIWDVDVLGPSAWLNPIIHRCHTAQYAERYRRHLVSICGREQSQTQIRFSTKVFSAAVRTDWRPSDTFCQEGFELSLNEGSSLEVLEIVRIIIWDRDDCDRYAEILKAMVDVHALFGVPVFYIEPDHAAAICKGADHHEFMIGFDAGGRPQQGYHFDKQTDRDTKAIPRHELVRFRATFEKLLDSSRLMLLDDLVE
jgi:3',5'-cyclic AMP phosphodiesterase CpdA